MLAGFSQLLDRGSEFLDGASSKAAQDGEYWTSRGSIFPCANGAASVVIVMYLLRKGLQVQRMPDTVSDSNKRTAQTPSAMSSRADINDSEETTVSSNIPVEKLVSPLTSSTKPHTNR